MVDSQETNGITDFIIVLRDHAQGSLSTSGTTAISDASTLVHPERGSERVIGKIGIYAPLDQSRSGEIGFLLNRSYHRRGLVSEALSAVIDYLFKERGVEAITTDVDPRNGASIGILQKHGFELTGTAEKTWEIGGEWVDSEFRTLTKHGWSKRQERLSDVP
jgi:RimJ/RimL family protein N-acetyltransferase